MGQNLRACVVASVLAMGLSSAGYAQTPPENGKAAPALPGTEEAPGYEDFEKGDLSPGDVQDLEERRDDRNVVSPGTRDEQELDQEMDADGN